MPDLTSEFVWYKDGKGYRLVPAAGPRLKPGQRILDAPASAFQFARIVGNGGTQVRVTPLKIGNLFERFAKIRTEDDVLSFVEKYGLLTSGLRGKGDVVHEVIREAEDMRSRMRKSLGRLIVSIDTAGNETRLMVRPACLLDAIWLQYAQSGSRFRTCQGPRCNERFLVGPDVGRRSDTQFCSNKCRVRFHRRKQSRR